jgi:Transposase DDE domain
LEVRRIWTSTELNGYVDFPYVGQVFVIQRETTNLVTGQWRLETVYGLTSLTPEKASPARLLTLNRRHWSIENGLHYVRDMSFDEDRCRIRKHAGAQVMASLRNLAISLLRLAGAIHIAPALRACAHNRLRPLRLIGLPIA